MIGLDEAIQEESSQGKMEGPNNSTRPRDSEPMMMERLQNWRRKVEADSLSYLMLWAPMSRSIVYYLGSSFHSLCSPGKTKNIWEIMGLTFILGHQWVTEKPRSTTVMETKLALHWICVWIISDGRAPLKLPWQLLSHPPPKAPRGHYLHAYHSTHCSQVSPASIQVSLSH